MRNVVIALVSAVTLVACSDDDGEPIAACYSGTDSSAMCMEQPLVGADDYAYAMSTCASGSGRMVKRCPSDNLVGVCGRKANVATSSGFQPRDLRVFFYRHPDVRDERAEAQLAQRCADGAWVTAEQLHAAD